MILPAWQLLPDSAAVNGAKRLEVRDLPESPPPVILMTRCDSIGTTAISTLVPSSPMTLPPLVHEPDEAAVRRAFSPRPDRAQFCHDVIQFLRP